MDLRRIFPLFSEGLDMGQGLKETNQYSAATADVEAIPYRLNVMWCWVVMPFARFGYTQGHLNVSSGTSICHLRASTDTAAKILN